MEDTDLKSAGVKGLHALVQISMIRTNVIDVSKCSFVLFRAKLTPI